MAEHLNGKWSHLIEIASRRRISVENILHCRDQSQIATRNHVLAEMAQAGVSKRQLALMMGMSYAQVKRVTAGAK